VRSEWVRGPGLNSAGAESRAEAILGVGWRSSRRKAEVLRGTRRGGLQLKLSGGEVLWVASEYIKSSRAGPAEPPQDTPR